MGVLLQNDQPVGGISADVIETINFSDLTTTSKTLPGAINELAANPSTTESMSQAEYNALTEAEKMDGTARFVYDAISTDESELWTRVGRNTLHTDAQIISNAINEIKDTMGSGTLTTTSPTIIGGINELNSSLANTNTNLQNLITQIGAIHWLGVTNIYNFLRNTNNPIGLYLASCQTASDNPFNGSVTMALIFKASSNGNFSIVFLIAGNRLAISDQLGATQTALTWHSKVSPFG